MATQSLSTLLAEDDYLKNEAPDIATLDAFTNPDALFLELNNKDGITAQSEKVSAKFKSIKTLLAACKKTMKDVESTSKQLQKAKKRYEEQCKRTLDASNGQMAGRPNIKGLEFAPDDFPIIRGWRTAADVLLLCVIVFVEFSGRVKF